MLKRLKLPSPFRFILTILAATAVCTATQAEPFTLSAGSSATFDYTSTFGSAGSAQATFSLSADGRELTVNFVNTSTANTYLSGLAFNATPNLNIAGYCFSSLPDGSSWSFKTQSGGGMGSFDAIAYGKGNNNRLSPGEDGTIKLTLAAPLTHGVTLDVTLVHLTSLPDGSSQKPVGVLVKGGSGVPADVGAPVPEPATLLLLGTGLAATAFRKRRRKQAESGEE